MLPSPTLMFYQSSLTVGRAIFSEPSCRLLGKVKPGGVCASVTGAPDNAKDYPTVRVVALVSKQDSAYLTRMLAAVESRTLVILIDRRIQLAEAAAGHAAFAKGGIDKVLLIP